MPPSETIFERDEAKSEANAVRRGFNFGFAKVVLDDPVRLERIDARRDYGEGRRQTIGLIGERTFHVTFTYRDGAIRIISARRAHDHEDQAYRTGSPWR